MVEVVSPYCLFSFLDLDLIDWVFVNLNGNFQFGASDIESKQLFAILCWMLWKIETIGFSNKWLVKVII